MIEALRRLIGEDVDLVVGDLSFISLTLVLPALVPLLVPPAVLPRRSVVRMFTTEGPTRSTSVVKSAVLPGPVATLHLADLGLQQAVVPGEVEPEPGRRHHPPGQRRRRRLQRLAPRRADPAAGLGPGALGAARPGADQAAMGRLRRGPVRRQPGRAGADRRQAAQGG